MAESMADGAGAEDLGGDEGEDLGSDEEEELEADEVFDVAVECWRGSGVGEGAPGVVVGEWGWRCC